MRPRPRSSVLPRRHCLGRESIPTTRRAANLGRSRLLRRLNRPPIYQAIMTSAIIIGGGASGVLAAAQLLHRGAEVTLLEPAAELGRGMAYSTRCPLHLLNVRAANMSAFPDDAEHFLRWLEQSRPGQYTTCSFVPRSIYGEYIQFVLHEALEARRGKFRRLSTRAVGARLSKERVEIETESSGSLRGDAVILATGNAARARGPASLARSHRAGDSSISRGWRAPSR